MSTLHTGHEADINASENLELTANQMLAIIKSSVAEIQPEGEETVFGDHVTAQSIASRFERIAKSMLIYADELRSRA